MPNGRSDPKYNNFTSISTLGRAVVDYMYIYIIVPPSTLAYFSNFEVHTVLDLVEELNLPYNSNAPDHSLLTWKYLIDSTCNAQKFYSRKDESRPTYI